MEEFKITEATILIMLVLFDMTRFFYLVLVKKPEPLNDLTNKNAVIESIAWIEDLSPTIIKGLAEIALLACFILQLPYLLLILPFFIVLLYKKSPKLTQRLIHTQGLTEEVVIEYYRQREEKFKCAKKTS